MSRGTLKSRLDALERAVAARGLDKARCLKCGGAKPGSLGVVAVRPREEVPRCEGCGVPVGSDGKALGERVRVVRFYRRQSAT